MVVLPGVLCFTGGKLPPVRFMFGGMWRFVGGSCADTWPGGGGVKLVGW